MSGLTPEGFVPKRTPELKVELEQLLLERFGSVNLNPQSVFGQIVGLTIEQQADFWARLEEVYWSQYPSSATGINLDRVASINGLTRLSARATTALAVLFGDEFTVIPAGRLVSSNLTGQQYELTSSVTLDADTSVGARVVIAALNDSEDYTININGEDFTYNSGVDPTEASILSNLALLMPVGVTAVLTEADEGAHLDLAYDTPQPIVVTANMSISKVANYGDFVATATGPISLPAGALTNIVMPVAGWDSVVNRFPGSDGRDIETDTEFRLRRAESLRLAGQNTVESITSRLRQLPGVLALRMAVNNTDAIDAEGIPAHSIRAIVDGGTDEAIAEVLFNYVAAGIGYFGAEEVSVLSEVTGTTFPVKFDRPVNVPYWVTVVIQGSPSTPTNVIQDVRDAMMAYADSLQIGEPVLYTRLFGPITNVIGAGAYVTELYINTVEIVDPEDELTANIIPQPDERLVLEPERIQVFVL